MKPSRFSIFLLVFALLLSGWPVPTAQAATICDWAQFIADVTIPDGTVIAPGTTFTKTWRLKNIGTCTWGSGYRLVFSNGSQMGAPAEVNLPYSVAPGQVVDVSVTMTAPSTPGTYRGYWLLKNAAGALFGLGSTANKPFWVEIVVPSGQNTVFDFYAQAPNASWGNASQSLPYPGQEGSAEGYATPKTNPTLENGAPASGNALLMVPQQVYNGVIYGVFPAFTVQSGDEFRATIGCAQGASDCYARFTLQYLDSNNALYTLWSFDERYDGLIYSARVPLNAIAGKTVRFVLKIRAAGSASGDQAFWVNPVIVRGGSVSPTPTPVGTVTPTPTQPPVSACDKAQFIADVTIPDGTLMNPGQVFDKTWRLKNIGTCTWTTAYKLVFVSGEQMGGPAEANLPTNVPPGSTVDLTVRLTAPSVGGTYRGYWQFKNANGVLFGIGTPPVKPWWVEIRVAGPTPTPGPTRTSTPPQTPGPTPTPASDTAYDFVAHVCEAQWVSAAGVLPCPGSEGDARGFVRVISNPALENGVTLPYPALLAVPQNVHNGYILGLYPPFRVQPGDRFEAFVGCEYGATSCLVLFRLDYRVGDGPLQTLWSFGERYDGMIFAADLDLTALSGQDVRFGLTILANGPASGDRALWVAPRIRRPYPTVTPSPTLGAMTPTATPIVSGSHAVVMVSNPDVLHIRSAPGLSSPIIGFFPYNATNVNLTGASQEADGLQWVEVQNPNGGTGWVNSYYLTERVTPEAFCADSRVTALVEQFRQAVINSNGSALAALVSPKHGVHIHYLPYTSNALQFDVQQVAQIFTSTMVYNWGPGPGGSPDVVGTFRDAILPKLLDVLNHPQYQTFCQELRAGAIAPEQAWPSWYTNYRYYTLYRPASPNLLDWRAWTLAIEYVNGQPKITAMIQYQWEP